MLSTLTTLRGATALQAGAIPATLVAGILVATLTHGEPGAPPGHLAQLLASHQAAAVSAHVATSARADLSTSRLRSAWSFAVDEVGRLKQVSRHYVVEDRNGAQDELEVLQFAHGGGVLTAQRTSAGITGIVLLVSSVTDQGVATTAATYARDLAAGTLQPVRAHFDTQMTAALPPDVFTADTAVATAGLRGPMAVAGQIVVRRAGLTVVETYLLFQNGLRRIEMTFDPNGSIAGLYIRDL